ncbi:MAG TPA: hypothetical protein VGD50_02080 [Candidatus Baltobacteraceae bacterium]
MFSFVRGAVIGVAVSFALAGCGSRGTQVIPVTQGGSADATAVVTQSQCLRAQSALNARCGPASGTITEYYDRLASPVDITTGRDGNLWFVEDGADADGTPNSSVDSITTSGALTQHGGIPSELYGITSGPGGDIWVTYLDYAITSPTTITTDGPTINFISNGYDLGTLTVANGEFWTGKVFGRAQFGADLIAVTKKGKIAATILDPIPDYPGSQNPSLLAWPTGFSTDAAGNVWFANSPNSATGSIGEKTAAGAFKLYGGTQVPAQPYGGTLASPADTTPGPGGIWFTEEGDTGVADGKIGRVAPDGTITEFGGALAQPFGITQGPDGNIWFTEKGIEPFGSATPVGGKIGKITPGGQITEYGGSLREPLYIVTGPDKRLWFTENGNGGLASGKIGAIVP